MSETKKILQRCEIAQADKWAIEDLYATDEAWSADLEKLKVMTQQLAAYAGHLADSPAKLLAYLEQTEAVGDRKSTRLNSSHRSLSRMPSSA